MSYGFNGEGNVPVRTNDDPAGTEGYYRDMLRHACRFADITLKRGDMHANAFWKLKAVEQVHYLKGIKRNQARKILLAEEESKA